LGNLRYNKHTLTKEREMSVKQQIFDKIAELQTLLEEAQCDGMQLAECEEAFGEVTSTLNRLADEVDYYVD
jgi:hypothetical protein